MSALRLARNGGPARARNHGWVTTSAPVVAFTDDDCVPTSRWLEAGLASTGEHDVVAGRTQPSPDQLQHLRAFSRTIVSDDANFVQTCNAFYRRAVLETLEGFDEALRTGEDTDLALRARERGCSVTFAPEALVHHDVRPSSVRATLRETLRWVDLPGVVHRHPQMRRTHLFGGVWWKRSHPPVMLAAAGITVAVAARRWSPTLAVVPWLRHRLVAEPMAIRPHNRVATLLPAFAVDLLEVAVMVRGSVKHRTVVL